METERLLSLGLILTNVGVFIALAYIVIERRRAMRFAAQLDALEEQQRVQQRLIIRCMQLIMRLRMRPEPPRKVRPIDAHQEKTNVVRIRGT